MLRNESNYFVVLGLASASILIGCNNERPFEAQDPDDVWQRVVPNEPITALATQTTFDVKFVETNVWGFPTFASGSNHLVISYSVRSGKRKAAIVIDVTEDYLKSVRPFDPETVYQFPEALFEFGYLPNRNDARTPSPETGE